MFARSQQTFSATAMQNSTSIAINLKLIKYRNIVSSGNKIYIFFGGGGGGWDGI